MIRTLVMALVALSLALPTVAVARTDPPFDPGGRQAHPVAQAMTPTPGVSSSSTGKETGFDWGDAAIGAAVGLGLMAAAGGAFLAYRREGATVRVPSRG